MNRKSIKGYAYLAPVLIILLIFTAYPLIKAFWMSFCEDYSIIDNSYKAINLENYKDLFNDKYFIKALTNTGLYVLFVVPTSIVLSLIIAVLLNSKIKFQGLFQTLYFLPYVTSVIAIGVVWRWIFNGNYGLLNYILSLFGIDAIPWLSDSQYAIYAVIIFGIWKSLAFDIMIFLAALQSISPDLYAAARVDSTPKLRVFFRITVPAMWPIISYAIIMGIINAFKVYNEVYSLFANYGKAGPQNSAITMVYYIYYKFFRTTGGSHYGVAAAGSVVLFVCILALTSVQKLPGWVRKRRANKK